MFFLGASNSNDLISQTSVINSTIEIATVSTYTLKPKNDEISPKTTNKMEYTNILSTSIESLPNNTYSTAISIITGGKSRATSTEVGLGNTAVPSTTSTFKTTTVPGNVIAFILII